ncbi:hypothetical protein [Lacticaseibacillus sp. 53-4]|uniref:hypothetical protein n=1 Tax=Lacticaseibacillus sp. 53-4 TaxID=2799575 RepID=UPI001942EEFB|nr:hypothetical protein [Lacticaseibacillus sp. 53-4]
MTEATAYRLKQIMTQEHLSLTQAAKQIGISASSMRKVLKDTTMSRPITFKINRFIEEHPVQQAKNSFTIFDSAEEEAKSAAPKKTRSAAKQSQTPSPESKTEAQSHPQAKQAVKQGTQKDSQKQPQRPAKQSQNAKNQAAKNDAQGEKPRRRGRRQQTDNAQAQPGKQTQTKQAQGQGEKPTQQRRAMTTKAQTQPQTTAKATQESAGEQKSRPSRRARKAEAPVEEQQTARTSAKTAQGRASRRQKNRADQPRPQSEAAAPQSAAVESAPNTLTAPSASTPSAKPVVAATKAEAPRETAHPDSRPTRQDHTILIYMDESFGGGSDYQRNMSIGATVVDPDDEEALKPFMQTLYPFGWQPGDEVKARGKAREQLEAMLQHANTDRAATYAVYSPLSDTGNFSLSFGILYPYVAALIRILGALPTLPTKVRVAMDQRSEITDEQLAMAARMLHAYVKAQTGNDVIFMFRTTDSKQTIGVQYSDFVSHAAMIFGPDQIKNAGIHKLPAIGTQLGDQLQLFAMVGLQKYLLDDGPVQDEAPQPFKNPLLNAADRMTHLAEKATDMPDVPEDTFAQAKLVVNQLLQIAPGSVAGAINKMPFQSWYDILARTAAILHYTDESLPPFRIDPDAMQIATDALNNIQALLAGAR